jgi:hypothetical protein
VGNLTWVIFSVLPCCAWVSCGRNRSVARHMSHNTCTQQQNPAREVSRRSLYFPLSRHQIFANIRSYIQTLERDIVMKRYSGDVDAHSQQGCDDADKSQNACQKHQGTSLATHLHHHTPHTTHTPAFHTRASSRAGTLARTHRHTKMRMPPTPTRRVPSQRRSIE